MTSNPEPPPEFEFVRHAAGPQPDWSVVETLATQDLDWDAVLEAAFDRHRVGPGMCRSLSSHSRLNLLPESVRSRFKARTRRITTKNLARTQSLLAVLDRFDEEGIPVIPFKGPVLSETVYDDFTLRHYRDVDILVTPDDMLTAESVLENMGYEPKWKVNDRQRRRYLASAQHTALEKNNTIVELHQRATKIPGDGFSVAKLIDRSDASTIDGTSVPALTTTDRLLLLCTHGSKHRWARLKWLCDVAYLADRCDVNWQNVFSESRKRNCFRRVLAGVALAADVFDISLPSDVAQEVRNESRAQALADQTYPEYFLRPFAIGLVENARYQVACRETAWDAVRYCWWTYVKPKRREYETVDLPEKWSGLYYPIRAVRAIAYFSRQIPRLK